MMMIGLSSSRTTGVTMHALFFVSLTIFVLISLRPAVAHSELLGAEFGYTLGGTTGPFGTDLDLYFNGTLDLPLFKSDPLFGQKVMAEMMVGHARSRSRIDPVLAGSVTYTKVQITTFHVFVGFKYKFDKLGEEGSLMRKIQPYLIAGPLFNLFLCRLDGQGKGDASCGAAPQLPELRAKGIPVGSGDVRFDYSIGMGVDFLVTDRLFIGADLRRSFSSPDARYDLFGGRAGFLF